MGGGGVVRTVLGQVKALKSATFGGLGLGAQMLLKQEV